MMIKLKCCICYKTLADGVSFHRVNAIGVSGIWVCTKHHSQTDAPPIHPVVLLLEGKTG